MNSLMKSSNGSVSILPQLSNWLEDFIPNHLLNPGGQSNQPSVNIHETDDVYQLEMAVPGMVKQDFKIELDNGILLISAHKERTEEEKDSSHGYILREFSYQSFTRSFKLPERTVQSDKITAKYENGILQVTIPKTEEAKPKPARRIEIV